MLSIVIPVKYNRLKILLTDDWLMAVPVGTLPALLNHTDIDSEVILSVMGGIEEDFEEIKQYLESKPGDWMILHEREDLTEFTAIKNGVDAARRRYVAIMWPDVIVQDSRWFGKMQAVFLKAPHPGLVAIPGECMGRGSMPPTRLARPYDHPVAGLILTTKASLSINEPSSAPWEKEFSQRCARNGSSRWVHNGVLFSRFANIQESETNG